MDDLGATTGDVSLENKKENQMTYDFNDFKFKVGDLVRHVTTAHNSPYMQEVTLVNVVRYRSLHEDPNGFTRTYALSSVAGERRDVTECELEAVIGNA